MVDQTDTSVWDAVDQTVLLRNGERFDFFVNDNDTTNDVWCTAIGDDAQSGTTNAPKASLSSLLNTYDIEPGDRIFIDTGYYLLTANAEVPLSDGGSNGAPVIIQGSTNGVVLDRGGTENGHYGLHINDADYVHLHDLEIAGGYMGLYLRLADYCVVSNVRARSANYGIYCSGADQAAISRVACWSNSLEGLYIQNSESNDVGYAVLAYNGQHQLRVYGGGTEIYLHDSILVATGATDYCIYHDSGDYRGDYNNLYAPGLAQVGFSTAHYPRLRDWQAGVTQDIHSLSHEPLFIDGLKGDFHLQSIEGRYADGGWTNDPQHSPCIDLANPATSWAAETTPNGARANQGNYGNSAAASRSRTNAWLLAVALNDGGVVSDVVTLAWAYGNMPTNEPVRIDYSPDDGSTWETIFTNLTADAWSTPWDATRQTGSIAARWRVLTPDSNILDVIDEPFMLRAGDPLGFYVNDAETSGDLWCSAPGDDTHTGLSSAPKATVQNTLDMYDIEPGDTLYIDTGYYPLSENIEIESDDGGDMSGYVTIQGSSHGTIIDRTTKTTSAYGIHLDYADYIALHDLDITNGYRALYLEDADHCVLSNLSLHHAKNEGLSIAYSDEVRIDHCRVWSNANYGIRIISSSHSNSIEHCTVAHNYDEQVYLSSDCSATISNSIIAAMRIGADCIYCRGEYAGDHNILFATNNAYIGCYDGHTYSTLTNWRAATAQDALSLDGDPLFVDGWNGDHHLRSSAPSGAYVTALAAWTNYPGEDSPGIDTGAPGAPCALEPHWNGGYVNIGCYGNTPEASRSVDTDDDWLSDTYEIHRTFTDPMDADTDDDEQNDGAEYIAGTCMTNPLSYFAIAGVTNFETGTTAINWSSVADRVYAVYRTSNLLAAPFIAITSNIAATPPLNTYTDTVYSTQPAGAYQLRVRKSP